MITRYCERLDGVAIPNHLTMAHLLSNAVHLFPFFRIPSHQYAVVGSVGNTGRAATNLLGGLEYALVGIHIDVSHSAHLQRV